jgi:putative multiple sugar transport system permease protein
MKAANFMKKNMMIFIMIILFVIFAILTGGRLISGQSMTELVLQNAHIPILAAGMTLCVVVGGIDLSVGSTVCLSAAVAAALLGNGYPAILAVIVPLLLAAVIGIWQGWLIGFMRIPAVLCTLAGIFLYRSLAGMVLGSGVIAVSDEGFRNLFTFNIPLHKAAIVIAAIVSVLLFFYTFYSIGKQKKSGYMNSSPVGQIVKIVIIDVVIILFAVLLSKYQGVPVVLIWILLVVGLVAFFAGSTVYGRAVYAVGGSEKAARLSGINPSKVRFFVYFIMSLLAGFAGLITAARSSSANGTLGTTFELDVLTACFIGGASLYGGTGSVKGAFLGSVLLGAVIQGMNVYNLPENVMIMIRALLLFGVVILGVILNKKKKA